MFQARRALFWNDPGHPDGYGLGFVQGDEVLLQKKPRTSDEEIDFFTLTRGVHADAFIGRVGLRASGVGAEHNADPFRYRTWLFGMAGDEDMTLEPGLEDRVLSSIPAFLRRNMRGHSMSEQFFHLFLAFLHDAGLLERRTQDPPDIRAAIHQSFDFLARLLPATQSDVLERLGVIVTNGRSIVAETRGIPAQYLVIDGIADCGNPRCPSRRRVEGPERRIAHTELRGIVVEMDPQLEARPAWTPLPPRVTLLTGADRHPRIMS
jgi:glutamine amidotransferase